MGADEELRHNAVEIELLLVGELWVLLHESWRQKIQGITRIDCHVDTVAKMDRGVTPAQQRIIFDVVDNQGAIMNAFSQHT